MQIHKVINFSYSRATFTVGNLTYFTGLKEIRNQINEEIFTRGIFQERNFLFRYDSKQKKFLIRFTQHDIMLKNILIMVT